MYFAVFLSSKELTIYNFRRNPEGDDTTMKRISRKVAESSFFYFAQIAGMGIGLLLAGASFLVAKQTAKRVFLVGRSRVHFETYGIFIPEKFETNLEQVSAKRGRNPEALSYIPIKVSERTLYVLLDQYAGHFPVPKLYDRTVGVTRPLWSKFCKDLGFFNRRDTRIS